MDTGAGAQSGLSGTVSIMDADWQEWSSGSDACDVDIASMTPDPEWEGSVWFSGTASCSDPLVSEDDSEVTVGTLSFTGSAPFTE